MYVCTYIYTACVELKFETPHRLFGYNRTNNGGKQWQTTPKNLPRMQRTTAIPVA